MKRNIIIFLIASLTLTTLLFTGCGKKESDTTPVFSETVEETEATEPEEAVEEVNDVQPEAVEPETVQPETDTSASDNNTGNGTGADSKTDEEIAAELEDMEQPEVDPSQEGEYDSHGNNYEKGEYNPDYDTNGGKGWDINGQHFDNWGDYLEYLDELNKNDPDIMTREDLEEFFNGVPEQ